jgi:uncharacterized membrane protein YedE/YeeE
VMEHFTPVPALAGGILIGLSSSLLLVLDGKIAGISGIVGGLLRPAPGDTAWRATFVVGLLLGGLALRSVQPAVFGESVAPLGIVALAGVLVGFGTRLGNGCTSGHGVCGNSRASVRSMVATVTFIVAGAVSVYVARHVLGGAA